MEAHKSSVYLHADVKALLDEELKIFGKNRNVVNAALLLFASAPERLKRAAILRVVSLFDCNDRLEGPQIAAFAAEVRDLLDHVDEAARPDRSARPGRGRRAGT